MKQKIVVKYGELTTKKTNRKEFIKMLTKNVLTKLKNYNVKVKSEFSQMYIELEEKDIDEVVKILKNIFGIHSIVVAINANSNIDDIKKEALLLIEKLKIKTFKVETKRSDKSFPLNSMEVSREIGAHILKNTNLKVDVHNYDFLLKIEIRKEQTFIFKEEIKGLGGYPVGIAGKGLVLLSGGIDSPVSAYLALKRGVKIECVYFESPPHTSPQAKDKVLKLVKELTKYQDEIKLHIVRLTELQEEIYKHLDHTYMITILRRMMYRISEKVALKNRCKILINGENIGQVASQTLESISVINEVVNIPVIRPLACFDKLEIIDLAKKINTYEISILPFEDCCTIFVPKHPVIHPISKKCLFEESKITYLPYIETCINSLETLKIDNKEEQWF